jgi:hypothetical protein
VTAPEPSGKTGFWYTTTVLAAAAFSLALIVDQALIVAAGRHLVGRIDTWLAGLQPEPARPTPPPPPLFDNWAPPAHTEESSENDTETPGL